MPVGARLAHGEGMNAPTTLEPGPIFQMLQGAHVAGVLRAGIEHRVFDAIAVGPEQGATVDAVAEARGIDRRGAGILLDALAALGLLDRRGGGRDDVEHRYAVTPLSATFLRSDAPTYVGGVAKIFASPHLAPQTLHAAVAQGGTTLGAHAETPEHPFWTDFADGSAAMAGPASGALVAALGPWLAGLERARVLDLACGSRLYGLALARAHAHVALSCQDWAPVLERTRPQAEPLGERVRELPGDLFEIDLAGPYELLVASHVFHHFDAPTNARLMARLAEVVAPGGKIAVHDYIPEEAPPSADPAPYLFSAMMLAWTRKGQAYPRSAYAAWLTEAGFGPVELLPAIGGGKWLIASRLG